MESNISMLLSVVIDWYFLGLTREEIAERRMISTGTVSNYLKAFNRQLDEGDVKALRDFAVAARKANISISQMADGARLRALMWKAGITSEEQALKFAGIFLMSLEQNVGPEELAKAISSTLAVAKKLDVPLEQVPERVEALRMVLEQQKADVASAEARKRITLREEALALQAAGVTKDELEEYVQDKEELAKFGASTRDVKRARALFKNLQEQGYSPAEVAAKLTEERALGERIKSITNELAELTKQKRAIQIEIEGATCKLQDTKRAVKQAEERELYLDLHMQKVKSGINALTGQIDMALASCQEVPLVVKPLADDLKAIHGKSREEIERAYNELHQEKMRWIKRNEESKEMGPAMAWFCGVEVDKIERNQSLIVILTKLAKEPVKWGRHRSADTLITDLEQEINGTKFDRAEASFNRKLEESRKGHGAGEGPKKKI